MCTRPLAASCAAVFACVLSAADVSAQLAPELSPADAVRRFQIEHGPGWQVSWTPHARRPRLIWGSRIRMDVDTEDDVYLEQAARHLVDELSGALGFRSETLVLERIERLALSRIGSSDKVAVLFRQEVAGIPVRRGGASVLFSAGGDFLALDSTGRPGVARAPGVPEVALGEAARIALDAFARETGLHVETWAPADPALVFYPVPRSARVELAWIFRIEGSSSSFVPVAHEVAVAARGPGRVLDSRSLVHRLQAAQHVPSVPHAGPPIPQTPVQVQGWGQPGLEPYGVDPEELYALKDVQVGEHFMSGTYTDESGLLFFDLPGPTQLTASLDGEYSYVFSQHVLPQEVPRITLTANPGEQLTFTLSPTRDEVETTWVNIHRGVHRFRDWILERDPTETVFDFPVISVVNGLGGPCVGVYYQLDSIRFGRSGMHPLYGLCPNMAYSTIIWHEEGHWANDLYGSGDGERGFHEGAADTWAMYIADDPLLGRSMVEWGHLRDGWNLRRFCGDADPECYGGDHDNGEVLMGALWKVRAGLQAELGREAGGDVADRLFLSWFQAFDDDAIHTVVRDHWLVLDDDDGNLSNGTPHEGAIRGGFGAQGFPTGFHDVAQLLPDTGQHRFGDAIALDGDRLAVGCPNPNTDSAVYVFEWDGTQWQEEAQLYAPIPMSPNRYGSAVALQGDTLVVGAPEDLFGPEPGHVWVYVHDGASWNQTADLTVAGAFGFGRKLVLDGDTLVVGAIWENDRAGAAYVYRGGGSVWTQEARLESELPEPISFFGWSLAYAADRLAIGCTEEDQGAAVDHGAVYVFTRSGTTWSQEARLGLAPPGSYNAFGTAVAMDPTADRLFVGSNHAGPNALGTFTVFERTGTTWSQTAHVASPEGTFPHSFGASLALDADRLAVGADNAGGDYQGAAYLYRADGTGWTLEQKLRPADALTGGSEGLGSAIALRGTTCIVGAPHRQELPNTSGKVYHFELASPFTPYGNGVPGQDGVPPVLWASGEPAAGGTIECHVHAAHPLMGGALYVGSGRASVWDPVLGGYVQVDNVTQQIPIALDVIGSATYRLTLPSDPGQVGQLVNLQWWSADPWGANGYVSSNAVELRIER